VPNNVVFTECTFEDTVDLSSGRFEQSLIFIDSRFRKGLNLNLAQIKGDVFLLGGSVDDVDDAPQVSLSRAQIDGQLQLLAFDAKSLTAEALKVSNVVVVLDDSSVEIIILPQIDAKAISLAHTGKAAQGYIGTLNVAQGTIQSELWLQDLTIGEIDAQGLHVNGQTALDPNLTVDQKLDISDSHLGVFSWEVPLIHSSSQKCTSTSKAKQSSLGWPCEILA